MSDTDQISLRFMTWDYSVQYNPTDECLVYSFKKGRQIIYVCFVMYFYRKQLASDTLQFYQNILSIQEIV